MASPGEGCRPAGHNPLTEPSPKPNKGPSRVFRHIIIYIFFKIIVFSIVESMSFNLDLL